MAATLHCKSHLYLEIFNTEKTHSLQRRNSEFDNIKSKMYELIELRQTIMSGTLPADELKVIKQNLTSKIDVGNS